MFKLVILVINTSLNLVKYNLNIYLVLFELKKLIFTLWSLDTHDIFLYLQFILCAFAEMESEN